MSDRYDRDRYRGAMRLSSCSPVRSSHEDPETLYRPGSDEAIQHYQQQIERREWLSMPLRNPPAPKYEFVDEWELVEK